MKEFDKILGIKKEETMKIYNTFIEHVKKYDRIDTMIKDLSKHTKNKEDMLLGIYVGRHIERNETMGEIKKLLRGG